MYHTVEVTLAGSTSPAVTSVTPCPTSCFDMVKSCESNVENSKADSKLTEKWEKRTAGTPPVAAAVRATLEPSKGASFGAVLPPLVRGMIPLLTTGVTVTPTTLTDGKLSSNPKEVTSKGA